MPFGGTRSNTTADSQTGQLLIVATLRENFGWRLRQLRDRRGMKQERFSELLGISVDFLSLIERGRNSPSWKMLEQFANRLEIPVAFLFDFRHVRPPTNRRRSKKPRARR